MANEDDLRRALHSMAPEHVKAGPSVADLGVTVRKRQRRNRAVAGSALGAGVLVAGIAALSFVGGSAEVVSTVTAADDAPVESTTVPADDGQSDLDDATGRQDLQTFSGASDLASDPKAATNVVDSAAMELGSEAVDETGERLSAVQQLRVQSTESPVGFAGSSGVFGEATADGFVVIAGRFGPSGHEPIVLRSPDGVAWESEAIRGLPATSSFVALDSSNEGLVGLVSWFDVDPDELRTAVVSSPTGTAWSVEAVLGRANAMPAHIAISEETVIVVSAGPSPVFWRGQFGGAFSEVGRIEATVVESVDGLSQSFAANVVVDGEIIAWESTDGEAWLDGDDWGGDVFSIGPTRALSVVDGRSYSSSLLSGNGVVQVRLDADSSTLSTNLDAPANRVTLLATGPLGVLVLEADGDQLTWHVVSVDE